MTRNAASCWRWTPPTPRVRSVLRSHYFTRGAERTVTVKITILNGPGALRLEPRHKTAVRDALSSSQGSCLSHRLHLRLCDFSLRAHVSAAHRLRHFSSNTSRRKLARKPHLVQRSCSPSRAQGAPHRPHITSTVPPRATGLLASSIMAGELPKLPELPAQHRAETNCFVELRMLSVHCRCRLLPSYRA